MIRFCFFWIALAAMLLGACAQNPNTARIDVTEQTNDIAATNLRLGIEYLKRGNYEKSLVKLNKALDADPDHPPTLNALGLLYQRLGRPVDAEKYFKRALRINPNDPYTLNNYGQFLCANNRYEEAETTFLAAASNPIYETPEIALTNAGTCALKNDQPDVAEEHFRNALKINPRLGIALIQMSHLSYDKGNYLSARAYLQRYLEVGKHTASTLWLGIRIEKELGDKNTLSSYALLLKNNFPKSEEARLLEASGIK